jgi:hypothetical protein
MPCAGFEKPLRSISLGAREITGQQTLDELKRRISSASWRRPKMNTWGYPIVEEVDHENVS